MAAFRYSLSVLKIYGVRYVYYRFSVAYIKILVQFVPKVSSMKNSYPLDT